jgi:hypothetical protein
MVDMLEPRQLLTAVTDSGLLTDLPRQQFMVDFDADVSASLDAADLQVRHVCVRLRHPQRRVRFSALGGLARELIRDRVLLAAFGAINSDAHVNSSGLPSRAQRTAACPTGPGT